MNPFELPPSKLGTKEHWSDVYKEELQNFSEIGDEGEIWFGIESVEKMVDWTVDTLSPSQNPSILEVGSGNGSLLFALAEAGYDPATLSGIDYVADAVNLSKVIASIRGFDGIAFSESDFLNNDPPLLPSMSVDRTDNWDLVLDKGTYDAIALGTKDENGRSPAAAYPSRVERLLKPGGYFLITSCNFTEEELQTSFTTNTTLLYHSRIQHPRFTFGGKSGSICSTIALRKPVS